MPTAIFQPTSPTNQNRLKVKISNFCVFCPIWIKFGIWANNGPRMTWYKFEMTTATFYASPETPHIPSRTIILFRFFFIGMLLISLLVVMYEYLLIKAVPAGGKINFEFNICANNHPSSNLLSHLISHPIISLISSLNSYLV